MTAQDNKRFWDRVCRPPVTALKKISGGRLSGMTDINPQWRYEAMTDLFGPCGVGWKYSIIKTWSEPGTDNQVLAFAEVAVFIKDGDSWSDPIPGLGGSMLVAKEKSGLHTSDEAYKMAVTDALGTAMKMLGIAADVYAGRWDGSKYKDAPKAQEPKADAPQDDPGRLALESCASIEELAAAWKALEPSQRSVLGSVKDATKARLGASNG